MLTNGRMYMAGTMYNLNFEQTKINTMNKLYVSDSPDIKYYYDESVVHSSRLNIEKDSFKFTFDMLFHTTKIDYDVNLYLCEVTFSYSTLYVPMRDHESGVVHLIKQISIDPKQYDYYTKYRLSVINIQRLSGSDNYYSASLLINSKSDDYKIRDKYLKFSDMLKFKNNNKSMYGLLIELYFKVAKDINESIKHYEPNAINSEHP